MSVSQSKISRCHTKPGVSERFIRDIQEITAEMMADPSSSGEGSGAMYGMAASIPDRSIVDKVVGIYLDCLYYAPTPTNAETE